MADWKLRLYHRSPPIARNLMASIRGYQLRSWRYGPETEQLVAEALERDRWNPEQWKTYQENRLSYVLHRAATRVPYYREQWAERRRRGDHASWERLENWPILTKEPLRANGPAFLADDCDPKSMYVDSTGGTTGTPLKIYVSRNHLRHWYALFEARWRRWYGLSVRENWAILGGQSVVPLTQTRPPFWAWNRAMNQLYLSANHVRPQNAYDYWNALRENQITHLVTYTSSGTFLAEQILQHNMSDKLPDLRAIVTNAEPVFDWQRDILGRAFHCDVHETYGMGEMVIGASADEQQRLRLWPEPGYVEVLADDEDRPEDRGSVGRFIATSLLNDNMPLIRYEVGDRSGFAPEDPLSDDIYQNPILLPVQGRNADMIVAMDGRRVFWINPVFYGLPVIEAQIVQETASEVRVNVVPAPTYTTRDGQSIVERLQQKLGQDMHIHVVTMDRIPRGPNGKFRAVISNLSPEERARVSRS